MSWADSRCIDYPVADLSRCRAGVALPNNFGDIALKEADKIKLRDNHGIDLFAVEEESGEDDD